MAVTAVTSTPLFSLKTQELQVVDLISQGKAEDGIKLWHSFSDKVQNKGFLERISTVVHVRLFQPCWEKRAKEVAAIFGQYIDMCSRELSPVEKLLFVLTKDIDADFCYSVIYLIQRHLFTTLMQDLKYFPFIEEKLLPALHAYYTTGCLLKLKQVLRELREIASADLFLQIVELPTLDLRKNIGSLLPERDFAFYNPVLQEQMLLTQALPFWKEQMSTLATYRNKKNQDKSTAVTADGSITQAKFKEASRGVSQQFIDLFSKSYRKAKSDYDKAEAYVSLIHKFLERGVDECTFAQYPEQIAFAISIFEKSKKAMIHLRDLNVFRFTYDLRKLEMEWHVLKSSHPQTKFSDFIVNKVDAEVTQVMKGPSSPQKDTLISKTVSIKRTDPLTAAFDKFVQIVVENCDFNIQSFSTFFTPLLETAKFMDLVVECEDSDAPTPRASERETKEKKEDKREKELEVPSPTTKAHSPSLVKVAPPKPLSSPSQGIVPLLQNTFTFPLGTDTNKAAARAMFNGRLQMENLAALLERLTDQPDNILPSFALMGGTACIAVENFSKALLWANDIPFRKSTHNLVWLAAKIPSKVAPFRDTRAFSRVNFAERDSRNMGGVSPGDRLSLFQNELLKIKVDTALEANIGRISDLLSTIFPLLFNLIHRGGAREVHWGDIMQKIRTQLQEPPSSIKAPPRHTFVFATTETLAKLFSTISANEANKKKILNLQDLLAQVQIEAALHPRPFGMLIHYTILFHFLPLIAEELIHLLFMKRSVETNPFDFKHNLLEMLDAAKVERKKIPARIVDFLKRLIEYSQLRRYPAKAKYISEKVKFIAECVQRVQGKSPNPLEKGFTPVKGSADEAFVILEEELRQEFKLLEEFAVFLIKLL